MHVVFVLCAHEPRPRVVSFFDDRQMSRQNTRAHARLGCFQRSPRVACPPSLARERAFAHSSVSYAKPNTNAPTKALCLIMLWVVLVNLTA